MSLHAEVRVPGQTSPLDGPRSAPEPDEEFTMQPERIAAAFDHEARVAAESRAAYVGLAMLLTGVFALGLVLGLVLAGTLGWGLS